MADEAVALVATWLRFPARVVIGRHGRIDAVIVHGRHYNAVQSRLRICSFAEGTTTREQPAVVVNPGYRLKRCVGAVLPYAASACRLMPAGRRRSFQAYCVGLPRSGTHSLVRMLEASHRCRHEAYAEVLLPWLVRHGRGELPWRSMRSILLGRDRFLWLEMDAGHHLHLLVEELAALFPKSVFIVTVREPLDWLESEINQELCRPRCAWDAYAAFRYGRYDAVKEKELPAESRIYGIAAYLQYWRDHVTRVLSHAPRERTLLLETSAIPRSRDRIAAFLGIAPESIDLAAAHAARRLVKPICLRRHFSESYLDQHVAEHCGRLWQQVLELIARQGSSTG